MKLFIALSLLVTSASFAQDSNLLPTQETSESVNTNLAPIEEDKLQISFGISHSLANKLTFGSSRIIYSSGYAEDGNSNSELKNPIGLTLGAQKIQSRGWGYSGFLTYEPNIKVTSYRDEFGGRVDSGDYSNIPEMSLYTIEGNAVFGFGSFYTPLGLNFTTGTYSSRSTSVKLRGAFGLQAGLGYSASAQLKLELFYRLRQLALEENFSRGQKIEYGTGQMSGLAVQSRFLF